MNSMSRWMVFADTSSSCASLRQFGNFLACNWACSCIMRASGGRENCSAASRLILRPRPRRGVRAIGLYHVSPVTGARISTQVDSILILRKISLVGQLLSDGL